MGRELVGYALHALEPAEEIAVRRHLAHCGECAASLPTFAAVLAELGAATHDGGPPPDLRSRILARTGPGSGAPRERPTTARPTPPPARRPLPPGPAGPPQVRRDHGPRRTARPGRRRRWVGAALAAACAVLVGGLAGHALSESHPSLESTVSALASPGSVTATLRDDHGGTVGAVVAAPGALHLVVAGLSVNASDQVYVLWALDGGAASGAAPRALGTFDAVGGRDRIVTLPAGAAPGAGYAVSLEQGRTAPDAPTRIVATT